MGGKKKKKKTIIIRDPFLEALSQYTPQLKLTPLTETFLKGVETKIGETVQRTEAQLSDVRAHYEKIKAEKERKPKEIAEVFAHAGYRSPKAEQLTSQFVQRLESVLQTHPYVEAQKKLEESITAYREQSQRYVEELESKWTDLARAARGAGAFLKQEVLGQAGQYYSYFKPQYAQLYQGFREGLASVYSSLRELGLNREQIAYALSPIYQEFTYGLFGTYSPLPQEGFIKWVEGGMPLPSKKELLLWR